MINNTESKTTDKHVTNYNYKPNKIQSPKVVECEEPLTQVESKDHQSLNRPQITRLAKQIKEIKEYKENTRKVLENQKDE